MRESRHNFDWSPHEARLRALFSEGKTCSHIAAILGHGVTRNAVIGKIHRLKMARLSPPDGLKAIVTKAARKAPKKSPWASGYQSPGLAMLPPSKNVYVGFEAAEPVKRRNPVINDPGLAKLQRHRAAGRAGHVAPPLPPKNPMLAFAEGYHGQHGRVALLDLEPQHCRFPVDMPDGAMNYCGLAKEESGSYCPAHAVRCSAGGVRA